MSNSREPPRTPQRPAHASPYSPQSRRKRMNERASTRNTIPRSSPTAQTNSAPDLSIFDSSPQEKTPKWRRGTWMHANRGPLTGPPVGETIPSSYRRFGDKIPKRDFMPGLVISIVDHISKHDQSVGASVSQFETRTTAGDYVLSKRRKVIVVHCYRDHCVIIPMFTHGGRGIAHMHRDLREEYIGVRDSLDPNKTRTDCSHGPPVIVTRDPQWADGEFNPAKDHNVSPKAYARFTQPQAMIYTTWGVVEGTIDNSEDVHKVQELVHARCPGPHAAAEIRAEEDVQAPEQAARPKTRPANRPAKRTKTTSKSNNNPFTLLDTGETQDTDLDMNEE